MVTRNRSITLISKINPEVFKLINKDVFGDLGQRLGSVQGAVNRILMNHEQMLKVLMPTILSTNPNDPAWYKKISNHWNSFGMIVPIGGKVLEIGFNFDLMDTRRSRDIKELQELALKNKTEIKTDEDLANYVLDVNKVGEFDRYKYANPIDVDSYLTWIYCLGHKKVANSATLLEKSTNIEFVLIDPQEVADKRKETHNLSIEATKKYLEILPDRKKIKDVLYIRKEDISTLDDFDIDAKVKLLADTHPKEFLAIINDPTMMIKARIEQYCVKGILKRLPDSSIIVDGTDNGVLIGNNLNEAVAYFQSEAMDKVAKVKEFSTRAQQISKINK